MKRNLRKECVGAIFEGVAKDGGFVFRTINYNYSSNLGRIHFKMMSYEDNVAEIAIDYDEEPSTVSEVAAGLLSKKSDFRDLNKLILNYRNIRLEINENAGRKDIYAMLMKKMAAKEYKEKDNDVFVDMETCCVREVPKYYDWEIQKEVTGLRYGSLNRTTIFRFEGISYYGGCMYFRDMDTMDTIMIRSLKDGKVVAEALCGSRISDFTSSLAKFFTPYSTMYGVKKVETRFNGFEVEIDSKNAHNVEEYYDMSMRISCAAYERELQEYMRTPEYKKKRAKELRKDFRKKTVIEKIHKLNSGGKDFEILDKNKMPGWKKCKETNSRDDYNQCIIDYTIFWAQCMEYMMAKHNKNVADIYEWCSHLADYEYGITGFMYGSSTAMLSTFWKYGEELRKAHNKRYGHEGDGVVNPAILNISA